jgi:hypothetical protein
MRKGPPEQKISSTPFFSLLHIPSSNMPTKQQKKESEASERVPSFYLQGTQVTA